MLLKYAYLLLTKTSFSDIKSGITLCLTVLTEYKRSPELREYVYEVT
jgi:hypothetical protein